MGAIAIRNENQLARLRGCATLSVHSAVMNNNVTLLGRLVTVREAHAMRRVERLFKTLSPIGTGRDRLRSSTKPRLWEGVLETWS